jgi:hypothetical protein
MKVWSQGCRREASDRYWPPMARHSRNEQYLAVPLLLPASALAAPSAVSLPLAGTTVTSHLTQRNSIPNPVRPLPQGAASGKRGSRSERIYRPRPNGRSKRPGAAGPLSLSGIGYSNQRSRRKPISAAMGSGGSQVKLPDHADALAREQPHCDSFE